MVKLLTSPTKEPLVSIIFPIYNSEEFLREAIDSLLTQTYENFEVVAINDGSTDKSNIVLKSYNDTRIKYIEHKKNQGLVATLNEGFNHAKGKYIARMDSDDICRKDRLKIQADFMESNPDIDILGSWIQNFGLYSYIWRVHKTHNYIATKLIFETSIAHPSVMMRRESVSKSGIKFEEKYHGAEDFMFWSKLSEEGLKFSNIQEPLLKYRTHNSQVGEAEKDIQQQSSLLVRSYNIGRLGISPKIQEKMIHQKLSNWTPLSGIAEVKATGRWLLKILNANNLNRIYDNKAMTTIVGEKWAVICYLSAKSNILRLVYLFTTPLLLPLALKTLFLRYVGQLYKNS